MLIPSWRAHLHPLVDDDARAALVTRHTLAFGPAVGFRGCCNIWYFLCGISTILHYLLAVIAPYTFSSLKIIHTAVSVHEGLNTLCVDSTDPFSSSRLVSRFN